MRRRKKDLTMIYLTGVLLVICLAVVYINIKETKQQQEQLTSSAYVQTNDQNIIASSQSNKDVQKTEDIQDASIELETLAIFLNTFYSSYEEAIIDADTAMLEKYFDQEIQQALAQEFKAWFIEEKKVIDSGVDVYVEALKFIDDQCVRLEVLEEVLLTNQEEEQEYYRIIMKYEMQISLVDESYLINERWLKESSVAKKQEGKWFEYR